MWRLRIRGRLRLLLPDNKPCPGLTQPELLLLAVLAASSGDFLSRADLASMIWEPDRCQDPRACLRVGLARLRSRLPAFAFQEDLDRLGLTPGWLEVETIGVGELYQGCDQIWAREKRRSEADGSDSSLLLTEARNLADAAPVSAVEFLVENERDWEFTPWHIVHPVLKTTLTSTTGQKSALRKALFACERHIATVQGAGSGGDELLSRFCREACAESDWVLASKALRSLLVRASACGNFRDSLYWCSAGERLASRLRDPYAKAGLLGNCGIARIDAMDFSVGIRLLQEGADAFAQAGHPNGQAALTTIRCRALALSGQVREARVVWDQAGAHYATCKDDRFAPWYRLTEALICRSGGDFSGAKRIAEELLFSEGFRPGISFVAACAETIASGRAAHGELGSAASWLWFARACQRVNNGAPSPLERHGWREIRTQLASDLSASECRALRRRAARLVELRSISVESGP
ncbi:MAG: hypothetical protein LCH41_13985 [Armatimonadetes bacterium]|nr:hypothetical protein [Armatimonadota bacterium]